MTGPTPFELPEGVRRHGPAHKSTTATVTSLLRELLATAVVSQNIPSSANESNIQVAPPLSHDIHHGHDARFLRGERGR